MSFEEVRLFLKGILRVTDDALASILLTLFVFFLSLLLTETLKYYVLSIQRKRIRKIVLKTLEKLEKSMAYQAKLCARLGDTLLGNVGVVDLKRVIFSDISVLEEVTFQKIFDAYFGGVLKVDCNRTLKLKAVEKIWATKELLKFWQQEFINEQKSLLLRFNSYNDKRNIALGNIRESYDTLMHNLNEQESIPEFEMTLKVVYSNWAGMTNYRKALIVEEHLVQPMLEICREFQTKSTLLFLNDLLQASAAFESMVMIQKVMSSIAKSGAATLRGTSRSLKVVRKILYETVGFVSWLKR